MASIVDKEILKDNIDLINIDELSINKIKRCLNVFENPVLYIKKIILNENSKVIKNGRVYFISLNNVMVSIDSVTYKILSAALV